MKTRKLTKAGDVREKILRRMVRGVWYRTDEIAAITGLELGSVNNSMPRSAKAGLVRRRDDGRAATWRKV